MLKNAMAQTPPTTCKNKIRNSSALFMHFNPFLCPFYKHHTVINYSLRQSQDRNTSPSSNVHLPPRMFPTISDNAEGRLDPPNTLEILKDYTNSFSAGPSQSFIELDNQKKNYETVKP